MRVAGWCRSLLNDEVLQQFPVLAAELWEQRANSFVQLRVLQDGLKKAPDRLQTVALLRRKSKKTQKRSRRVQILVQRRGLAAVSCPGC